MIVGEDKQPDAEGVNWVLADAYLPEDGTEPYYLCYWDCPAYSPYWDTNDWQIYQATPREASIDDKLQTIYDELFYNGFTDDEFAVGTNPGNISQELYDKIKKAYDDVNDAMGSTSVSDDAKEAILKTLVEIQDALNGDGRIKPQAGKYYYFVNQRSQDAVRDNGGGLTTTRGKSTLEEPITLSEARYVWSLEDAGNGQFYIKNFSTGNYVGGQGTTSSQFPASSNKNMPFNITFNAKGEVKCCFNVSDNNGYYWHNDGGYTIVNWDSYNAPANLFKLVEVPAEKLNDLIATIEKNNFMAKYNSLILDAKSTTTKYTIDSDVTFDGTYSKMGLFSSFEKANATEPYEGSEANAFDGDPGTYYHTLWSSAITDDYNWVQVNLGDEPIQKLFLKMTQRINSGGNPVKFALVAQQPNVDEFEGIWTDTLYRGTVTYDYPTNYSSGIVENSTAVLRIDLGKPVTHLRFVGMTTKDNFYVDGAFSPCWHIAEFHMYKDGGDNPRYALIPENIRQALSEAIAKAEKLSADSTATQADYDALQAAIKAFNDAYPDDTELNDLLKEAKAQAEAEGMVGNGWGQFPADAQTTLAASISEVSDYIKAHFPLTLTAIAEQTAKVRAAISTFNSKLIVPEDGTFVRIKSVSKNENGEENDQYGNYVYPYSTDSTSYIYWYYATDENKETRLSTVWQLQKQDDGTFAFKSLTTGRYMGNMYKGVEDKNSVSLSSYVMTSDKPAGISLVSAKKSGIFNLQLTDGVYVNASGSNNIINWNSSSEGSMFELEQVSSDIVSEGMTLDVKKGVYQVVTLPFDAAYVAPSPYKVLGQKDGKLQLAIYGDDETIPAGTPFIVMPEEETNYVQIGLVAADADELANGSYVYDQKTQNGLVGVLNGMNVKAGLGLLIDNVVKNSVDNTWVAGGSGYFVEIPETTEDGDVQINIEEIINGISNATVAPAAKSSAIYTISGVKISNAKSVEGLPKGLYIVGGKKVYVK